MCYYNGKPPLPIADSICSLTRASPFGSLNLHKSNAAQWKAGWLTF